MKTTQEYFNKTIDQLLVTNEYGYTKEENLIYDDGLEVVFFDDESELENEIKEFSDYIESKNYEVKNKLKTINKRIAIVLI